ncbi:hypothetical protein Bbelb_420300 [Branchiostoma belcheri]|nr:hypothetical protein Bbelb_420300 [Branchiostoma belcheri]
MGLVEPVNRWWKSKQSNYWAFTFNPTYTGSPMLTMLSEKAVKNSIYSVSSGASTFPATIFSYATRHSYDQFANTPPPRGTRASAQRARIEAIQRRACRIILGPSYTSYAEACRKLDLPTLEARRRTLSYNFARRMLDSETYRTWLPPLRGDISTRDTRYKHLLNPIKTRTSRYYNSPIPYMTRLLNEH